MCWEGGEANWVVGGGGEGLIICQTKHTYPLLKFPKMVSVKIVCLGQLLNNLNSFKGVNCQFLRRMRKHLFVHQA